MSAPVNPLADTNTTSTTQNSDESQPSSNNPNTQDNTNTNETTIINNESSQPSTTTTNTLNNQSEEKASENENIPPEPKPKPKRCPHINNIKKKIKKFHSISCEKCPRNSDADDKLVFCLSCFKLNCSRTSSHAHGFNHWSAMTKHSLCMMIPTFNDYMNNTKDIIIHDILTIWCYKCDSFLHELNQDNTPKIKHLKYEVYGCLQRGYKKLANKHKQKFKQNNYNNNYNSVSVTPNYNTGGGGKNKKKKDKYSQYKNQYNNNQQHRNNNNKNINIKSIEEWSKLDNNFITKMRDDRNNGYIGIFGLSNLGNTCFFNSILQNLSETRPLIKALTDSSALIQHQSDRIQEKDKKNANKMYKNKDNTARGRRNAYGKKQQQQAAMDKKLRGRLLTEFNHVINDAYNTVGGSGRKGAVVPSGLLNAVIARNRRFAGRRQQDSHELMRVLVEGMRDQNEKMLKKARKHRMNRNISNWKNRDILDWAKCYNIELRECKEMNTQDIADQNETCLDDIILDISLNDFIGFIKCNNDDIFFTKLGLNIENDENIIVINKWKRGRMCLTHEQCKYYCKKHGYDLKTSVAKPKDDMDSKVHDIENKPLNKINTIIDDVFGGEIQSCVTCYGCGNVSRTTEEFFDLSLPISNPKTSAFGGGYSNNNAWFTKKKSKKQKKKERQQRWAQQNKKNTQQQQQQNSNKKNKKKNKGNKQQHKHKKSIENEENIELADNIAASINISKAYDKHKDNKNKNKIDDKPDHKNDNNTETQQQKQIEITPQKPDKSDDKPLENTDKNTEKTDDKNNDNDVSNNAIASPMKSEISKDSPVKSKPEIKTDNKDENKPEEKEKYVPTPLPSIRGMGRLKGDVNLLDVLAAFTDPELLSDSDKYGCKYCTRKALQKIKDSDENKWDDIIKTYLILQDKINKLETNSKTKKDNNNSDENDEYKNDNDSDNSSDSDDENKIDLGDEIDRIMSCGYPLKRHNAKKQILIHKPPCVLALHLKRFEQQGYRLSKVSKKVRFPLHLNIGKYLTNECKMEHVCGGDNDNVKCMYQLYGISVHHGSMGGGHYIAYTHKNRNKGPKEGWYYFSDSSCRSVGYQDAMKAEAYVLFYQKCENIINVSGDKEEIDGVNDEISDKNNDNDNDNDKL